MPQLSAATPLLKEARQRFTQRALAARLRVTPKTVARWERGETNCPALLEPALREILRDAPVLAMQDNRRFTFVDLFAGIGGIRLGFESAGGECIFTSEWNDWSKKTYLENFGNGHPFVGDIVPYPAEEIPDHDVLLGGFPCQPFSIAGMSKKNALGRPHGFECTTQGTLFFDVARVIAAKRPKAFLLENVKNLLSHDKGNTFRVIIETLRNELGYDVHYKVVDGQSWVPQHRERILIAGFRDKTGFSWDSLCAPEEGPKLSAILHPGDGSERAEEPYTVGPLAKVHGKYTLSGKLWAYLQAYAEKHRAAGNGFGFGLVTPDNIARTLSARYYKDGSEILVSRGKGKNPRRLTPRECARLMGFPDTFRIPVSDTQAYKLFSQAAVVPMIKAVADIIVPYIIQKQESKNYNEARIMIPSDIKNSNRWTKEQLELAFHLYCQLPFGKMHYGNPEIVALANLIGRTPSAVAMKLVNFASLDPAITGTGRKGLGNVSAADRAVWEEFHADWEGLTARCEQIITALGGKVVASDKDEITTDDFSNGYYGANRIATVSVRVKQQFFRKAVLASYQNRCCMSGTATNELLVASHIVPWAKDETNRLNPHNGLCLSALHDKAFDRGLITVIPDMSVRVSGIIKKRRDNSNIENLLASLDGRRIQLPEKFLPSLDLLRWHNENSFME